MTVSELGERRLLARIRARLDTTTLPPQGSPARQPRRGGLPDLVIGIGDDGAIVAPSRNAQTVLTTDAQIEGVHFERRFSAPADIGYRALAVNLSDLAAMGAVPRWVLLSLALPANLAVDDVDGLVLGLAELAGRHGVVVIGGNLTRSPGPLMVDITAVGETRPRRALTRGGGRPGDVLYVSGAIGAAAAGLEALQAFGGDLDVASSQPAEDLVAGTGLPTGRTDGLERCIARYRRPEPRVRLGMALARDRAARAAMDLSDGLADAADQVAAASGCGVEIDAAALPIEPAARRWWESAGVDAVAAALGGGDDYELLFAAPRAWAGRLRHITSRIATPELTAVGVLTKHPGERVLLRDGRRDALPAGYGHFGKAASR